MKNLKTFEEYIIEMTNNIPNIPGQLENIIKTNDKKKLVEFIVMIMGNAPYGNEEEAETTHFLFDYKDKAPTSIKKTIDAMNDEELFNFYEKLRHYTQVFYNGVVTAKVHSEKGVTIAGEKFGL